MYYPIFKFGYFLSNDACKSDRSHRELSNEHEEEKSSTQREVTLELFFSRDGELRDIQEEFSEYVRYMLRSLVQMFIFQSLSISLHLHFEPDPYSNKYVLPKIGFDTAENEPFKVC